MNCAFTLQTRKNHLLLTPLMVAAILLASAASPQDRQPARAQPAPASPQRVQVPSTAPQTIPVERVSPDSKPAPRMLELVGFVPKPAGPVTLPPSVKAPKPPAAPAGDFAPTPDAKLTSIKLTAKNPYAHNRGFLKFNETRHVDTNDDYVVWYHPQNKSMGYAQARLNLEKGKRYLLDANISCDSEQTFYYGTQQTTLQKGSHHLLVFLEPQASGWTSFTLWNDYDWAFYSLEVTLQE